MEEVRFLNVLIDINVLLDVFLESMDVVLELRERHKDPEILS